MDDLCCYFLPYYFLTAKLTTPHRPSLLGKGGEEGSLIIIGRKWDRNAHGAQGGKGANGKTPDNKDVQRRPISVSGDETWKIRGFNSNVGVVTLIRSNGGKAIATKVLSLNCKGCEKFIGT